jgi:origin recognition complex subunit 1
MIRRTVELVQPKRRTARLGDVKEVIQVMQNSPTAAYLRECSFHERVMLASLIKCIKREGVEEIQWGEVICSLSSYNYPLIYTRPRFNINI